MSLDQVSTSSSPPSYSDRLDLESSLISSGDMAVPPYTPGRQTSTLSAASPPIRSSPKDFSYPMQNKGKMVAELTIIADEAISKTTPIIVEGSPIHGSVKLSLETPDSIRRVLVSAKGQIFSLGGGGNVPIDDSATFFEVPVTLWSQSMGNPRGNSTPINGKYNEKLQGEYEWTFAIDLPREVVHPHGLRKELKVFRLPQTFMERHARASICYEVVLRICRSKLRTDYRINAHFGFIPLYRPGPASVLRQLAYQENVPIPGPAIDPEGWHTVDMVRLRGRVFGARMIDVGCMLSIAKPLCYTRGSVIPVNLLLESQDEQAVDLLSSPRAVVLRLRRCIKYHANAEKTIESFGWRDAIDHSQLAIFWPSMENIRGSRNLFQRQLHGELHLRKDLKPTSAMVNFRIEYHLVLFPFDMVAFEPSSTDPLLTVPIEIATMQPVGPTARMYAPPSYESSDVQLHGDFFAPINAFI